MAAEAFRLQSLFEAAGIPDNGAQGCCAGEAGLWPAPGSSAPGISISSSRQTRSRGPNLASTGRPRYDLLEDAALDQGSASPRGPRWPRCASSPIARPVSALSCIGRLFDGTALLGDMSVASEDQEVALSEGMRVRTLSDDALFSYLCVHGAVPGCARF